MGTATSCTKCNQLVVLIHTRGSSSNVERLFVQLFYKNHCYIISDGNCHMDAYLSSVGMYSGFLVRYHCSQLLKWFHQHLMLFLHMMHFQENCYREHKRGSSMTRPFLSLWTGVPRQTMCLVFLLNDHLMNTSLKFTIKNASKWPHPSFQIGRTYCKQEYVARMLHVCGQLSGL